MSPDPTPPSTALAVIPANAFAITATEDRGLKAIAGICDLGAGLFDLTQVRIPAGGGSFFNLPDERGEIQPAKEIVGVIAAVRSNLKSWFAKPFSETGGGTGPDCSSGDGLFGFGVRDLPPKPEGSVPKSKLRCSDCRFDQFGSARKGAGFGKGKDCQDFALLLIYRDKDFLPIVVKASATSLKALKKYGVFLEGRGRNRTSVTTIIGLKTEQSDSGIAYSEMTFRIGSFLDDEASNRFAAMELALSSRLLSKFDPATAAETGEPVSVPHEDVSAVSAQQ